MRRLLAISLLMLLPQTINQQTAPSIWTAATAMAAVWASSAAAR